MQGAHQVQRHAVRIGARQRLGVQLQRVAQIVVRTGISLFQSRQGLFPPHPAQCRQGHADQQRQCQQRPEGTVERGCQRQPRSQWLHRNAQQQQRQGHRDRQNKTLQQAALVKTALHLSYEFGEDPVVAAHGCS